MATINLSLLSIPIPEPYDKSKATQQQENFFYVLNQVLDLMKQESFVIFDNQEPNINISTTGIKEAIEKLQFNGQEIEIGDLKIILFGKTTNIT